MSHVGVAACPKCGARYGVQENAAGQTLPCPACGTKFVVQPVARAADDFLPPSVDLAAGGPIVAQSRVLDPVVYPHRDIPWALIAIGTGLCLVLGMILFGGWQAYKAIDAVASASFEPIESATAASDAATGAATDVADQVAADATAAVQGAGKAIDRLANAVSNSIEVPKIEVPKILGDSHERLADERDRLQADYVRIRNEFAGGQQSETAKKLLDLQMRVEDLAIRWYLLPPMTEGERDRLKPRLAEQMKLGFGGQPLGDPDPAFDSAPTVSVVAVQLSNSVRSVTLAIVMGAFPQQAQGPFELKCAELADGSREVCRQLYSVHSTDDIDRIAPRVQEEIARFKAAGTEFAQMDSAVINLTDLESMGRIATQMAKISMVTIVVNHVSARYGRALAKPSDPEDKRLAAESAANEFARRLGLLMNEYQIAHLDLVRAAMQGRLPGTVPSAATSVSTAGGPTINMPGFGPPGFGPAGFGPPGFGPPAGIGPRAGFGTGGVLDGSNPHPSPEAFSGPNMDAEFEARRQAFIQRHGADETLTVRASGGTEGQFKALEVTVMRLVRPRGHSMNRVGDRYQLSVLYAGDVERIARAITAGEVTDTDVNARLITVKFK